MSVSGDLFGGQIAAALIVGTVKINAPAERRADTSVTDKVITDRILYGAVMGDFDFKAIKFTFWMGLSELGPLAVMVKIPVSIPLGNTGLAINSLVGGIEFNRTLPRIDDPLQLRSPAFQPLSDLSAIEWQKRLEAQVANQSSPRPTASRCSRSRW